VSKEKRKWALCKAVVAVKMNIFKAVRLFGNQTASHTSSAAVEIPECKIAAQRTLHKYYLNSLVDPFYCAEAYIDLEKERNIRKIEKNWNKWEESRVESWKLPEKASQFPDWFKHIEQQYLNDSSQLFNYLAHEASVFEMALYLNLEEKVDGKFDDLIALSQLGIQDKKMKLTLARNYWDEMGNGNIDDIHSTLFAISAGFMNDKLKESGVDLKSIPEPVEAFRNANLQLMYGTRRWFAARFLGVLGILEQTAWQRFEMLARGFSRLGIPEEKTKYQSIHIKVDKNHGNELFEDVLQPLVNREGIQQKHILKEVCIGALIRMHVANDYYAGFKKCLTNYRNP